MGNSNKSDYVTLVLMEVSAFVLCIFMVLLMVKSSLMEPDTTKYNEVTVPQTRESRFLILPLPYDKKNSEFGMLVDKQTRVEYLYHKTCGSVTPLLDRKGNISYYNGKIFIE